MNIDYIGALQLMLLVLSITTIFLYLKRYTTQIKELSKSFINVITNKILSYSKNLWIIHYEVFEKYGVWRFVTKF